MLDLFTVFTRSGLVLWCFQDERVKIQGSPINELVREVLIEQRSGGEEAFIYGSYALEFKMHNELDLVFVAMYQKSLQRELTYVGDLVDKLRLAFVKKFESELTDDPFQEYDFSTEFAKIRKHVEDMSRKQILASTKPKKAMRTFEETKKFKQTLQHNDEFQSGELGAKNAERAAEREETKEARIARNQAEMQARKKSGRPGPMKKPSKKPKTPVSNKTVIDYSDSKAPNDGDVYDGPVDEIHAENIEDLYQEDLEVPAEDKAAGGLFSYFTALSGGGAITPETLAPVLDKMRMHLISKNVAADIAEQICDGVGKSLEGKSKSSFSKIANVVQSSIEETLTSILSPKRRVDILRDIIATKKQRRPYVIVFCGVNGVGKSTNLSKICYWLLQNENSVCIAACDTFRAGAVEQLKTHCRKLTAHQEKSGKNAKVLLFERGYSKDAAGVASEAIAFSKDEGYDVVLVDTAGRMQDNEPLMRALAKLVTVNKPDLTLFVGEALVGNESVDQLSKFNQSLADHSGSADGKGVDGIVLTKFDTVDDKVGAAISMTYITGQPIVFVGTGQTYGDLKKLNVKSVVKALLQ